MLKPASLAEQVELPRPFDVAKFLHAVETITGRPLNAEDHPGVQRTSAITGLYVRMERQDVIFYSSAVAGLSRIVLFHEAFHVLRGAAGDGRELSARDRGALGISPTETAKIFCRDNRRLDPEELMAEEFARRLELRCRRQPFEAATSTGRQMTQAMKRIQGDRDFCV